MSREARVVAWIAILIGAGWLINVLNDILLPFVAGAAIAYVFDPAVSRLQKMGLSRTLATTVVVLLVFLTFVGALALLVPLLQDQIVGFLRLIPGIVDRLRETSMPLLQRFYGDLSVDAFAQVKQAMSEHAGTVASWLRGVVARIWQGGMALVNLLSLLFITPVVAFYLLRDWDDIVAAIDANLPRQSAPTVREQAREIDRTVAGFLRGQAAVCATLGVFYAVSLGLIGLNSGIIVGLVAGLISFIPFVGAMVGFVVSVGIALVQFTDVGPIAMVAGVFIAGQTLEGYFLTPKLVGDRVGLSPVWIIFALLAGGALFGFTGVLLAVPVAASTGVLVRFALGRYRDSDLYEEDGQPPASPPPGGGEEQP